MLEKKNKSDNLIVKVAGEVFLFKKDQYYLFPGALTN